MNDGHIAGGLLLVVAGLWLGLQAVVGDLAGRLLSWAAPTKCDCQDIGDDLAAAVACCRRCPDATLLWAGDVIPCRDFVGFIEGQPGTA